MECNICTEKLNTVERRPKCLPCAHTVCLHCLMNLGTQTCPQCRQAFAGPVNSLPDNYFLLGLMNKERLSQANQGFWCRDCSKVGTADCMDLEHAVCSVRKYRSEQAAPRLELLQNAATSSRKVVQALQAAKDGVDAHLVAWRRKLQQAEEAERRLRVAVEEGGELEEFEMKGVDKLQEAVTLLEARCQVQVAMEDVNGTEWKAELQMPAPDVGRSLINPFVLQLLYDDRIVKIRKPAPAAMPAAMRAAPFSFSPAEIRNVSELSQHKKHSKALEDFLRDPELVKVRRLDGVHCEALPTWCSLLLQRVAPRLESLSIRSAVRQHLDLIGKLRSLRYLSLHVEELDSCGPDLHLHLPPQLEDLELVNCVSGPLLRSLERLPNLQKLTLDCYRTPAHATFAALPLGHRGLRWLNVRLRPAATVLSLAKAHAATLQELRVMCASLGSTLWHFTGLAEGLRGCGLTALRRVVLVRGPAPGFTNAKLSHGEASCRQQKQAVWDALLSADPERAVRVVSVLCAECDKCPSYPKLGRFTWEDT